MTNIATLDNPVKARPMPVLRFQPVDDPNGVTYKTMLIETQLELATQERIQEKLNELLHIERNKRRRLKEAYRNLQAAYNEKLRLCDSYFVEADYYKQKYDSLSGITDEAG